MLSAEVHARGVYPPVDPLRSLSRLMRHGAGPGRTRDGPPRRRRPAARRAGPGPAGRASSPSSSARRRSARPTARYLAFAQAFEQRLLDQRRDESRTLDETLDRAWQVLLGAAAPRADHAAGRPARRGTTSTPNRVDGRRDGLRGVPARPGRPALAARPARHRPARAASCSTSKLRILGREQQRYRLRLSGRPRSGRAAAARPRPGCCGPRCSAASAGCGLPSRTTRRGSR